MARLAHQTKTEIALHVLRDRMRTGQLKPGERLRVNVIREELQMSPTPIREALRLLQADGLVTYEPHLGIRVARLSPETTEELCLLRCTLEALAVELAVARLSDDDERELERMHEALTKAVDAGAGAEIIELNAQWHWKLYDAARSAHLADFIRRLWDRYPWRTMWVLPGRTRKSLDEHEAVMKAIRARDVTAAAEKMRTHIESGAESLLEEIRASEDVAASVRDA